MQNQSLTKSVLNPGSPEVWRQTAGEREFRVAAGVSKCGGFRAKPVVIGLLCALATRRRMLVADRLAEGVRLGSNGLLSWCDRRTTWECDWDPNRVLKDKQIRIGEIWNITRTSSPGFGKSLDGPLRRRRQRHSSPRPSIRLLRHALTEVARPHCATRAPWLPFRHKQQLHIKGGPPPCYPVVNSQQASV